MKRADRLGAIAAAILCVACLAAGVYHLNVLMPLHDRGESAPARVTGVHRGARNSKWAEYEFVTATGKQVRARDALQLYIWRPRPGDDVDIIYDPADPSVVTADLGIWIWQGAMIFIGAFAVLLVLLIAIVRKGRSARSGGAT